MNSENSKTSKTYILIIEVTDKLDLRRGEESIALSNLSICYQNIKSSYNSNKFKILVPTWNDKFLLPNESYSILNMQDYFEYILQKNNENIDNLSIRIYVNKIENKYTFKIKTGCFFGLLTPETIKLLGSIGNKITKYKTVKMYPI